MICLNYYLMQTYFKSLMYRMNLVGNVLVFKSVEQLVMF